MITFKTEFNSVEEKAFTPKKAIVLRDRNIIISKDGYIKIARMISGINVRVSTNLKATSENIELVKKEAQNYILRYLEKKGYILAQSEGQRQADEYLHESFLYFLNDLSFHVKESSFAKFKSLYHILKNTLPHKRTNNIDKYFLHNYAIMLHKKNASRSDIKFKISAIVRVVNHYRGFFDLNPLQNINLKNLGIEPKEKTAFSEVEINKILCYAKNDEEFYNYLMIASHTGARVGEILALQKKDINLKNAALNIDKQESQNGKITTTKTKSSNRSIPFINAEFQSFMQKLAEKTQDRIFNINRTQILNKWKKALKDLGMQQTPIYRLRHTFATLAISKSSNILAVSQMLGHANANITLQTYAINKGIRIEDINFNFNNFNKEELLQS